MRALMLHPAAADRVTSFPKSSVLCLLGLMGACGGDAADVFAPPPTPNEPPVAAFSSSCADLVCSFSNSSADADGRIVAYRWSFGDGSADDTTRDARHTYTAPGTYAVALTVTDDRSATASETGLTPALTRPNAFPVVSFGGTCAGLTCSFSDSSSDADGAIVGRHWEFGDGEALDAENPAHTYAAAGVYLVTLTVTDDRAATTATERAITVTAPAPVGPTLEFSDSAATFCFAPGTTRNCVFLREVIRVTSVGGEALKFTVTSDRPWIVVSPVRGRAPAAVEVSIDLTQLRALPLGSIARGSLTVSAAGASNSPWIVPVRMYFYAVPVGGL